MSIIEVLAYGSVGVVGCGILETDSKVIKAVLYISALVIQSIIVAKIWL